MNPICQQCGTHNVPGAAFCDNCGSQLLPGESTGYSPLTPTHVPPAPVVPPAPPLHPQTVCLTCGTPYQIGEMFCGNCGATLGQVSTSKPAINYPPAYSPIPAVMPPAGNTCPQCGTRNEVGTAFCDNCGASQLPPHPVQSSPGGYAPDPGAYQPLPQHPPQQGNYGNPPAAAPYTSQQGQSGYQAQQPYEQGGYAQSTITPRLVLQANNVVLPFPVGKPMLIIGREDPVSSHFPELDLGPYGAEQMGVSRSHARFIIQGNQIFIEDMQAVNYTFVNRQKLAPHTKHPLQNGDEIRLGKMVLHFYLQ